MSKIAEKIFELRNEIMLAHPDAKIEKIVLNIEAEKALRLEINKRTENRENIIEEGKVYTKIYDIDLEVKPSTKSSEVGDE